MARGGARPGAGRPKGAASKRSQEVAAMLAESGQTPLEALAELQEWAMREFRAATDTEEMDFDKAVKAGALVADWAAKAAPYRHPRLSSVEANVKGEMTYEERLQRLASGDAG